jgi:hypothetical protein
MPGVDDPQACHTSVLVARKKRPHAIDRRLGPGELVLGAGIADLTALAYPLSRLRERGRVAEVDIAGEPYLFVLATERSGTVFSRRLDDRVLSFVTEVEANAALTLVDDCGTRWNAMGEAVAGEYSGRRLRVLSDTYVSKWSEWSMSHPSATIVD